jgi:hypothetical protein
MVANGLRYDVSGQHIWRTRLGRVNMWRLGVPKKYVMNIPISGFLAAITIKVLGRFVPEAYAFGVGGSKRYHKGGKNL